MPPNKITQAPTQSPVTDRQTGLAVQTWWLWFQMVGARIGNINQDFSYSPPTIADADALPNSIYFSSTANKLVYKTAGGVVNALY